MNAPWAVLLCKFSDDLSEPARDKYERLFTPKGAGTMNMVRFFSDVSHGHVDTSGSEVHGWYTLDQQRSDYKGSGTNGPGRQALIDWASQKAHQQDPNVNWSQFVCTVVCMNVPDVDLFGSPSGVVCSLNQMEPSLLGQEMGHGFGLDHSRADGSTADYMDRWDVMSTVSAYMASDPDYGEIGPGLNAANMDSRAWLDMSRVWTASSDSFNSSIQLRPLHRGDLPGLLAARLGEYYVEFRVRDAWDAGIPEPVVLVHRFDLFDNHSYLMSGTTFRQGLRKGDAFEFGDPNDPFHAYGRVEVLDIDEGARTATIRLARRPAARPPVEGPGSIFGGIRVDGGGVIIIGGRALRVSPRSPVTRLLRELAVLSETDSITDPAARETVRNYALREIATQATSHLERAGSFRSPSEDRLRETEQEPG